MKKKLFYIPLIILITAFSILLGLVQWSDRPNAYKNGFNREFDSIKITLLHQIAVKGELYKICGSTTHKIFFFGKDPRRLIIADYKLNKLDSLHLPIPINRRLSIAFGLFVDSPNIELYAPNLSAVFYYQMGRDTMKSYLKLQAALFTRYVPVSSQSLIIRGFDSLRREQSFMKVNRFTGKTIKQTKFFTDQPDAGFSTDGSLVYDSLTHSILYVQINQNRVLCLDTNLNVEYVSRTIDTTNTNSIHTRNFASDNQPGSLMPSTPIKVINKKCYADKGNLFVLSNLRADNETDTAFFNNKVIDIYNIKTRYYTGSFYIPDRDRQKVRDFRIDNNMLIVLYEKRIALYQLNL